MFKIAARESVKWPVTVAVPGDGGAEEATFTAELKLLDQDALDRLITAPMDAKPDELVLGWEDVRKADGLPLAWSAEAAGALWHTPYVRKALVTALIEAAYGARAKN